MLLVRDQALEYPEAIWQMKGFFLPFFLIKETL